MDSSVFHEPRKKPLITYSRIRTRALPLNGADFLKSLSSDVQETPLTKVQDQEDSIQAISNNDLNQAPSNLSLVHQDYLDKNPSYEPIIISSSSDLAPHTSKRRRHLSRLVCVPELEQYIFASPLSETPYEDTDPILDDESESGSKSRKSRPPASSLVPISVMRKALRMPPPYQSVLSHSKHCSPPAGNTLATPRRDSDGFTTSELPIPSVQRRKKTRVPRFAKKLGVLEVSTDPSPEVHFGMVEPSHKKPRIETTAHATSEHDDNNSRHEQHDDLCEEDVPLASTAEPYRQSKRDERIVYAQLSSISAPRHDESSAAPSDDSEDEDHQLDLLESEEVSLGKRKPCRIKEQPVTALMPFSKKEVCESRPGQIPRLLLNSSIWIGVGEDIQDDELHCMQPCSMYIIGRADRIHS